MNWSDLGKKIIDLSPEIGLALSGPGGAAIGAILASQFGSGKEPEAVSAAISADPEAAVKLQQIKAEHDGLIASLARDKYLAALQDVQDARKQHADHWMPSVLTVTLTVMVSAIMTALIYVQVPDSNKDVVYLIVGQIIGAFASSISYWIGSSRGSVIKNGPFLGVGK